MAPGCRTETSDTALTTRAQHDLLFSLALVRGTNPSLQVPAPLPTSSRDAATMLQLGAGGLEPPASRDGPTDHSVDGSQQMELAVGQSAGVGYCLLTLCRLAARRSLFSWSSWSCILSRASRSRAFSSASLWASSSRLDISSWHLCRDSWFCLCKTGGEDSIGLLPLTTPRPSAGLSHACLGPADTVPLPSQCHCCPRLQPPRTREPVKAFPTLTLLNHVRLQKVPLQKTERTFPHSS